ncbi:hypothetical protein L1987_19814 [Smallanthus sonchifolius]|uniref:Uncharacterized protein n=1 Tax=Smallanthus sonchifolius TaxID=185202 RepID=A0ACB9IPM7_9ASTR|nr:hypothetical protein L1987_19814 [Smallanthus sonchifolius]
MASSSNAIEVPVFIDTSLGTHIVISVSPDLTAGEFKNKFEIIHLNCYPGIGNIKVHGLMVKKRSHLYHLPESMPIKLAFQGSKKAWFLYTQVDPLNKKMSSTPESEVVHRGLSENRTENSCKRSRKKMKVTDFRPSFVEPTIERMSESISVSGIIKKYFSVFDDEATSSNPKTRAPSYAPKTPPTATITKVGGSREKKRSCAVGSRLIVAANHLGISTSDKKPVISLCRYKCDEFSVPKSSSLVRHPVFEIGEE